MQVIDIEDGGLFSLVVGATANDTVYRMLRQENDKCIIQVAWRKIGNDWQCVNSHEENCNPYAMALTMKVNIETKQF